MLMGMTMHVCCSGESGGVLRGDGDVHDLQGRYVMRPTVDERQIPTPLSVMSLLAIAAGALIGCSCSCWCRTGGMIKSAAWRHTDRDGGKARRNKILWCCTGLTAIEIHTSFHLTPSIPSRSCHFTRQILSFTFHTTTASHQQQ